MIKSPILSIFAILLFSTACTHKPQYPIVVPADTLTIFKNLVYGADTIQQSMDVYLPATRDKQNTPMIIMIHGGSWVQGDKDDFNGFGVDSFFTANGCAVVNMNYRLDSKYQYPAPVDDIGMVMEYVKQKAAGWKVNPDRICLMGRSVGSHLALIYAYSRNNDNRIKVVMDFFGPTDLTDSTVAYDPLGLNVTYMLGPYITNKQLWQDASPVHYMAGAVPTIIFHGMADSLVYFKQAQILTDSLSSRGIPALLVPWPGLGHGWSQEQWIQWRGPALSWVKQFL